MLLLMVIINFIFYYIIQIMTNITFFFVIEALLTLPIFMGKYKCVLNI